MKWRLILLAICSFVALMSCGGEATPTAYPSTSTPQGRQITLHHGDKPVAVSNGQFLLTMKYIDQGEAFVLEIGNNDHTVMCGVANSPPCFKTGGGRLSWQHPNVVGGEKYYFNYTFVPAAHPDRPFVRIELPPGWRGVEVE